MYTHVYAYVLSLLSHIWAANWLVSMFYARPCCSSSTEHLFSNMNKSSQNPHQFL